MVAYDLRHNYAIENISAWDCDCFEAGGQLLWLSRSMGHRKISSTLYYYSVVPRLADKLLALAGDGMDDLIPAPWEGVPLDGWKTCRRCESILVARCIHDFVHECAPTFLTSSHHTLKGYRDAITLYLAFLQGEGVDATSLGYAHLERRWIERWIAWLRDVRGCSPDTCNNRLAAIRRLLEYLGSHVATLSYLYVDASAIKRQRPRSTRVEGMSRDAVRALLSAPDTTTWAGATWPS